jgi:EPS-associated MarR family transcriptional regulator
VNHGCIPRNPPVFQADVFTFDIIGLYVLWVCNPGSGAFFDHSLTLVRSPKPPDILLHCMNKTIVEDGIRVRLLKCISDSSCHLTQRDIAEHLGISLGKTHYCLADLINCGYVKAVRFKNTRNKAAYAYSLTPQGVEEKLQLMQTYLHQLENKYRNLGREITRMLQEMGSNRMAEPP